MNSGSIVALSTVLVLLYSNIMLRLSYMKHYLIKLTLVFGLLFGPLALSGSQAFAATVATSEVRGARDIVKEIIDVIGLKPRFELRAADIENAAAVAYNGKRYILYNEQFLASINNAVHTDWGGVSILAHEIGHHLNGHTLTRTGSNHGDELEADEFSGFVLRKLGASLAESQAAINLLSEDRNSATHPGRGYRLASIKKGWQNADSQLLASARATQPSGTDISPAVNRQRTSRQVQARSQNVMDNRSVLTRVHFNNAPDEQFYLTAQLNLVHVTEDGYTVIGKLARTNNRNYPYYFESEYMQPLFVSEKGLLVNQKGQRVGYLT